MGNHVMTHAFVEILLLVPAALCAGFVIFIAGVIQGVMNDLDEAAFKRFLTLLKTRALRSPYTIGVSSITFVGMVPYFIYYGFSNRWFTAGLVLWVIASIVSKASVLPDLREKVAIQKKDVVRGFGSESSENPGRPGSGVLWESDPPPRRWKLSLR
jgi:hypothetical protein